MASIVVVSGLPRSGTSMMMHMLAAGGLQLLADGARAPDDGNPNGYFELERVKRLTTDSSWIGEATGRAVKIVSPLLHALPPGHAYDVILMRRPLAEVLASQRALLRLSGVPDDATGEAPLQAALEKHLARVAAWRRERADVRVLDLEYRDVVARPLAAAASVCDFLARPLDCAAMARVVDRGLYRERATALP